MDNTTAPEATGRREAGHITHRRETNRQIYLPFLLGVLILVGVFLLIGIPADPIWRFRAQAMGDFLYTLFCILPVLVCLLPFYLVILLGIYGMRKVHTSTERPLRRLEVMSEKLASQIEKATAFVNQKTISLSSAFQPIDKLFSIFEPSPDAPEQEKQPDESRNTRPAE